MSSRDLRPHFRDILQAIEMIHEYLTGLTFDHYLKDRKTRSAVERELQIITEASFRLKEEAQLLCPEIPWTKVRGMGNVLRHEYEGLVHEQVWNTIREDLPKLRFCAENALQRLETVAIKPDP